jgi:hypothetical protein
VTTAAAREALLGRDRSRSGLLHKWQHALPPARDRVWRSVITLFVSLGRPPYLREIGEATGVAIDQLREIMTELEAHDLLGIDKSADRVRYAYPFTGEPNEHRVQLHGRELHALCAIDALGIGGMLGTDVVITASCRACGKPIEVTTAAGGKSLGQARPADAVVWYDLGYTGCAAASSCPSIAFFCSDTDHQRWLSSQSSRPAGHRLALGEALEMGRAIFEPVLATATAS